MTPADTALLDRWRRAHQAPVEGWDFSDLDVEEPSTPWSYERLAREALAGAGAALDLGTGGGEVAEYDAEGPDPRLPFPDGRFDVVLDRHEAYPAAEVFRVLRPGGRVRGARVGRVAQPGAGAAQDRCRADVHAAAVLPARATARLTATRQRGRSSGRSTSAPVARSPHSTATTSRPAR